MDPSGLSDIALNPGEWLSDPTGFQNPRMFPVYYGQGSWLRGIKRFFQWLGLGTAVAMSEATDGEEAAEDADADADAQATEASNAAVQSAGSDAETDNSTEQQGESKRHSADQEAVVSLAKEAKKSGGVNEQDARALVEWGHETGLPSRGPEAHPNRAFGKNPHIHVGPVDHIPINP